MKKQFEELTKGRLMQVIYEPRGRAREYAELALNIYTGCSHGCKYCYAPSCLFKSKEVFHGNVTERKDLLKKLSKDLETMEQAKDKRLVLFCFTTDPYTGGENQLTRAVIEAFNAHGINFQVLTKGGGKASRDFDLYKAGDKFATTLTFLDEAKSLEIEPKAALPADRIATIKKAHELGIETWVSFEPVLDPEEVYQLFEKTYKFVDLYKVGKVSNYPVNIDWKKFGHTIISMMEEKSKKYYIKKDLKICL